MPRYQFGKTEERVIGLRMRDVADMTDAERRAGADWLRQRADELVANGASFKPRVRLRFLATRPPA